MAKVRKKRSGKSSRSRSRGGIGSRVQNLLSMVSSTLPNLSLSRDRKRDLIGLVFIGVGIYTTLGAFSPQQGSLSRVWLRFLEILLGWGAFLFPLLAFLLGVWLIWRSFSESLPQVEPEQVLGGAMMFMAVQGVFQLVSGAWSWPAALDVARQGGGGGLLGAALLGLLVSGLGEAGAIITLVAWTFVGLTFTAGLSAAELVSLGVEAGLRMWRRLTIPGRDRSRPSLPAGGLMDRGVTRRALGEGVVVEGQSTETDHRPLAGHEGPAGVEPREWAIPEVSDLLEAGSHSVADDELDRKRANLIAETLKVFGAPAQVVEINRGPTITQFGVEPAYLETRGGRRTKVKVSKIAALADDLALAMAAPSIRIEAPVPGKGYVGIEVPNAEISLVALRDVMESDAFQRVESSLALGLGKDVSGRAVAADLAAMPHLLVAGTTGSGKSVCVNANIACLLLQNTPAQLRFLMIDPKRVELTHYNGIPHLLTPVVVELERVVGALKWVSREMDERYRKFSKQGVRNIADYNQRMVQRDDPPMYYIAVVIDELADLMMMAPDETERVITRLAQLARATGIHLIIATQRPSVDVVTGLIKANFPARIAFAVASSVDSRVIIDQPGAERLLGKGDMLFQAPDAAAPIRMQGSFVSERELDRLIRYWKMAALGGESTRVMPSTPTDRIPMHKPLKQAPLWEEEGVDEEDRDDLFEEAVEVVREMRRGSISLLQRRLRIGYTRAARLVDQLEAEGIVGPDRGGSNAREVLDYGEESPFNGD